MRMKKPLPLALLLCATLLLAGVPPAGSQGAVRQELLERINAERSRAGAPPLRLSRVLTGVAQRHVEEIEERGTLRTGSSEAMQDRIERAGYDARQWTESLATTQSSPAALLREWSQRDRNTYRQLLDPDYRDLGIGVGRLKGSPLYAFLYAVPQSEAFNRETAHLRDVQAARAEMLAKVNAIRRREGLEPLRADSELQKAAQAHAQDMLERGYFEHRSPSGTTVRERSRAAGYDWRTIGENIAEGQQSVEEVMDTWMRSPGHRRNILSPQFEELGVGLAVGHGRGGWRILWVQNFGTPR